MKKSAYLCVWIIPRLRLRGTTVRFREG